MSRNCPSCGITLSKADVHFCSSCGSHLDSTVQSQEKRYFSGSTVGVKAVNISFPLRPVVVSCVICILLGGAAYLIMHLVNLYSMGSFSFEEMFVQKTPITKTPVVVPVTPPQEIKVVAPVTNNSYPEPENLLPFDTEIALLFTRPADFLEGLAYFGVENTVDMDFLQNSNRPPYIILLSSVGSGSGPLNTLMFFPSKESAQGSYSKYFSKELAETEIKNARLVSNDSTVAVELNDISQGLKKGLGLNSLYITIRNKIPKDSKSKVFVFTDNGVGYVNRLEVGAMPESLKALFMNYLSSGSYYGFIQ